MTEIERAITHFSKEVERQKMRLEDCPEDWGGWKRSLKILLGHNISALAALSEKREMEKGCEHCDFSSGDVGASVENTGDCFVLIRSEDSVSIATDDVHFRTLKIDFCPMCGRRLTKEANHA